MYIHRIILHRFMPQVLHLFFSAVTFFFVTCPSLYIKLSQVTLLSIYYVHIIIISIYLSVYTMQLKYKIQTRDILGLFKKRYIYIYIYIHFSVSYFPHLIIPCGNPSKATLPVAQIFSFLGLHDISAKNIMDAP